MKRIFAPLLALLLLLFFYDVIFLGKSLSTSSLIAGITPHGPYGVSGSRPETPFSFDTAGDAWVNEPNPYIIKRTLKDGLLPAWNPYEGLGMPLIGNLNSEVFNPLKIFLNLRPSPYLQDIFFILRLFVIGLFTCLYLREKGLKWLSSFFGAAFLMLSGYSLWWINLHPLSSVMYIPAVFYFYERWWNRGDRRSLFFMACFTSFSLAGGKVPDVIMGFGLLLAYAAWKGVISGSFRAAFKEVSRVVLIGASGALMAAAALFPFLELYAHASPLAKVVRTGSSGHAIPFITSISLFQPLFLGPGNYFYSSWLKWTPQAMLPYAGIVILMLLCYALLDRALLKKNLPYVLVSLFIFSVVYGILPSGFTDIISALPVLNSIAFLKYNAMLYFSISVLSASALDNVMSSTADRKKFYIATGFASFIVAAYYYKLDALAPYHLRGYLGIVLALSLSGLFIVGLTFYLLKGGDGFGKLLIAFLVLELFLYMPKGRSERTDPYREAPYINTIRETYPYRLTGGGDSIPPLVSNAAGLYDIRAINVLLSNDYYLFFQNLISFSVPYTNNPYPVFTSTSPFIDLLGVRHILSSTPLDYKKLEGETRFNVSALRWIRLIGSMVNHSIKGGSSYGFVRAGDDERFSFIFPAKFTFRTKLKITEPYIFAGLAKRDFAKGMVSKVKIRIDSAVQEVVIDDNNEWKDRWLDVSNLMGKVVIVTLEGEGDGGGSIALGNFGLSPGAEEENRLCENLLRLHNKELNSLKYMGKDEGLYIYENENVMDRAFVLHKTKRVDSLAKVITELQGGFDFRETGLVAENVAEDSTDENAAGRAGDKVSITKYTSGKVTMEVESKGGVLVLSDLYYPGWKVKVNGREEEVIKVFGLLRGVVINAGRSEVVFYYRPVSLYAGITVSILTLFSWVVFIMKRRSRGVDRHQHSENVVCL